MSMTEVLEILSCCCLGVHDLISFRFDSLTPDKQAEFKRVRATTTTLEQTVKFLDFFDKLSEQKFNCPNHPLRTRTIRYDSLSYDCRALTAFLKHRNNLPRFICLKIHNEFIGVRIKWPFAQWHIVPRSSVIFEKLSEFVDVDLFYEINDDEMYVLK